tara:strand:- start:361 stop:486 length:126 start_codon:yes stop_codon:yes gene_type:complete
MKEILNPHYFVYNSDGLCVGFNIYEEPTLLIPDYEDFTDDE